MVISFEPPALAAHGRELEDDAAGHAPSCSLCQPAAPDEHPLKAERPWLRLVPEDPPPHPDDDDTALLDPDDDIGHAIHGRIHGKRIETLPPQRYDLPGPSYDGLPEGPMPEWIRRQPDPEDESGEDFVIGGHGVFCATSPRDAGNPAGWLVVAGIALATLFCAGFFELSFSSVTQTLVQMQFSVFHLHSRTLRQKRKRSLCTNILLTLQRQANQCLFLFQ